MAESASGQYEANINLKIVKSMLFKSLNPEEGSIAETSVKTLHEQRRFYN